MNQVRFAVLAGVLALPAPVRAAENTLTFLLDGKPVAAFTKVELASKIKGSVESFYDPLYGKTKRYACLPIDEVMRLGYGPDWQRSPFTEAILTAMDGYGSFTSAGKLAQNGGCLAIRDEDFPGWEPMGRKRVDPGPFYLAWMKPEQSTENGYAWPYKLVSINLVRFEERYPELLPRGAAPDSPAYRGYLTFRAHCMRCHAINRQGGTVGPDLNAPQSVTAYHAKEYLEAYIRQPSKFRYTEMPDSKYLKDADLEDLYQYLLLKASQPQSK